jgi:aldehyde dehydrogenase (NAD+)
VVTGTGPEAGAALIEHQDVRRIAFTGSVATGKHLAGVAASRLIPVTLELGGKSPIVVFADADLERAVPAAVAGIQANSGQICSANTRLLVEDSLHDEFVARVVERIAQLQPGPDFGPIITEAQYGKVLDYFTWASENGLTPAVGGGAYTDGPGAAGLFVQPTVTPTSPPRTVSRRKRYSARSSSRFGSRTRRTRSASRTAPSTDSSVRYGRATSRAAFASPKRSTPDRSL